MIQATETVRSKCQTDQFMDVSYYRLIADPIEQLQEIYQWIGMEFDDQAVNCAEQYIKTNPKNRFGRHSYCMRDFGLTEEDVEKVFLAIDRNTKSHSNNSSRLIEWATQTELNRS